jgi:hypothetical protein
MAEPGWTAMSDPIRDALIELVNAVTEQFFNANNAIALSSRVITATSKAMRQLLRQAALAAPPPAPGASITPDLDALLSPEGAYQRGTGQEDGAQLVSDPHGPEWWVPQCGCETLDNLLDRLRSRILPHLRQPAPAAVAVAVAERPWEREGWCDADGKCWWGRQADDFCNPDWHYATRSEVEEFCSDAMPQVSLPWCAIPTPQPPQGGEVAQ